MKPLTHEELVKVIEKNSQQFGQIEALLFERGLGHLQKDIANRRALGQRQLARIADMSVLSD